MAPDGRQGSSSFEECLKVASEVLPIDGCKAATKAQAGVNNRSHALLNGTGTEASSVGAKGQVKGSPVTNQTSSGGGGEAGLGRGLLQGEGMGSGDPNGVVDERTGKGRRGSRCRVDGVEVPPLSGSRFLAVENLFWTAKALGLHQEATLQVSVLRIPRRSMTLLFGVHSKGLLLMAKPSRLCLGIFLFCMLRSFTMPAEGIALTIGRAFTLSSVAMFPISFLPDTALELVRGLKLKWLDLGLKGLHGPFLSRLPHSAFLI